MEQDTVIKVEHLYKKFTRSLKRSLAYGTIDLARNLFGIQYDPGILRKSEFWSLDDINFEVKKGETFGLVGANGSGKSTLLRLINGIFPPDKGSVMTKGRIGALIAVGAGFHPHMTGRENILLNGTILGMTKQEVMDKMDDIINFAEIGEFLDSPVSTYSSGMYVRLGFAIAIHSEPDIVLVDEILAVGDAKFQRKCLNKIKEMREKGVTFILVTHNMDTVSAMCQRAILLDRGKQILVGPVSDVVSNYELLLNTEDGVLPTQEVGIVESNALKLVKKYHEYGTDELEITSVSLVDEDGENRKNFDSGDQLTLEVNYVTNKQLKDAIFYSSVVYVNDNDDDEANYVPLGVKTKVDLPEGSGSVRVNLGNFGLTTGRYKISIRFYDESMLNPFAHGHYGYFFVKGGNTTLLRSGRSTPLIWLDPDVKVTVNKA